jgi:hemoglobin/transferrin/lactoferrin receptor protein
MNSLDIKNFLANSLFDRSSLILAHQLFEESRHDRSFGRDIINHQAEMVDVYSLNFDLSKKLDENQNLFYGAEIILNKVGSTAESENIQTGTVEPIGSRYPDGSTNNSYAVYLNYKNSVANNLTWQASGRYTHTTLEAEFDTTFYPFPFTQASLNTGAVTGSTGLTFRPAEDWQLNLNFSTGFRAPNIDDIGKVFESEPGAIIVPNPQLEPEYAYSIEGGIIKKFDDLFKFDVNSYYIILEDALVRRPFSLNGQDSILFDGELSRVLAIQNAAKAYSYGVEAGVEIKLPAGFGFSSRINFQKGEEQDEESGGYVPLRHAAPFYAVSHLSFIYKKLRAELNFIYSGEISYNNLAPSEQSKPAIYAADENGNPYSPAWYILNLKTALQVTDFLQLNAGIENITDQRYRPYSSGISAAGRNFIFSFRTGI